ncbi:hypothetical protein [Halalkalibacter alkalisediminis]|uniref:Uncharacterized protein n=1 Tax=Halalkalibacter alkalisediminis TaxID=935616 RepID=A0ABV6NBC2_9BACI|nr:hypothetical protein [Halalkalibacter alkalisediminis]
MQLTLGILILLFILSFLSLKEVFSKNNQNGIEVESPVFYLLTSFVMTFVPVLINPVGVDLILIIFLIFIAVITGWRYYRLPKITLYQTDWLFAVSTVRRVLDHLGYDYEKEVKQKDISESHVYIFQLENKKGARIEIEWEQDEEDNAKKRDIMIRFKSLNKIDNAVYLHGQVLEAFRLRREGQRSSKQTFMKRMKSVFAIVVPIAYLLFIILK